MGGVGGCSCGGSGGGGGGGGGGDGCLRKKGVASALWSFL